MAQKFFIHSHEKLLIERDYGSLGTEITSLDGPMTLEEAQIEFAQDGKEYRAFRFDGDLVNIENVTEDLFVEPEVNPVDNSWVAHVRASKSTSLYI